MDKFLVTKEVAQMLRLSEEYVRELIRQGKIKAYKQGRRGGYRVSAEDVEEYIKTKYEERGINVR